MTQYEQAKAAGQIHICSNGEEVWPVQTRFGRLWAYGDGSRALRSKEQAIECAYWPHKGEDS